jgi:hypothetical protein
MKAIDFLENPGRDYLVTQRCIAQQQTILLSFRPVILVRIALPIITSTGKQILQTFAPELYF